MGLFHFVIKLFQWVVLTFKAEIVQILWLNHFLGYNTTRADIIFNTNQKSIDISFVTHKGLRKDEIARKKFLFVSVVGHLKENLQEESKQRRTEGAVASQFLSADFRYQGASMENLENW